MSLLSEDLLANIGRSSEPHRELVTRRDIRKYAVATGNRQQKYLDGDQAREWNRLFDRARSLAKQQQWQEAIACLDGDPVFEELDSFY